MAQMLIIYNFIIAPRARIISLMDVHVALHYYSPSHNMCHTAFNMANYFRFTVKCFHQLTGYVYMQTHFSI